MSENITLPREVVEKIHEAWSSEVYPPAASTEWYDIMDALRTALAAEPTKPARLHVTTTGVLLGSAWLVWNTPVGANDEIMSQETADLLNRIFADAEALRRDAERYRYLRDKAYVWDSDMPKAMRPVALWLHADGNANIDAAIDAAMGDKR